jgi:hypothetical protein
MAAPRKWSDAIRADIHQLVNEDGRPATQIAPLLKAKGHAEIPSLETIRDIARATRHDITDKPKHEQLRSLLAGLVKATDAEITRVQAESGDDAPDQLLKLARTIREIEPLLTDTPKGKRDDKPQSLLQGLDGGANTQHTAKQQAQATPRSLSA